MKKLLHILKTRGYEVIGAGIIILLILGWNVTPKGHESNVRFYDSVRTIDERDDIVIVGIDDASLQALGAWPWDRSIFANLVTKLDEAGAKVTVFDVLFLEERKGDDTLLKSLGSATHAVILGAKTDSSRLLESYLVEKAHNTNVKSAIANVQPDNDGKVRLFPSIYRTGGGCLYGLADTAFLEGTFGRVSLPCVSSQSHFRYPRNVTTYSLVDVLRGNVSKEKLKDKVVFIGSVSLDLEDHFISFSGEKIPGVYVHASALASRLLNVNDREIGTFGASALILLYACITLLTLSFTRSIMGQVVSIVLILLSGVVVAFITFTFGIEIPAPALILTILTTGGYSVLVRFVREKKKNKYIENIFSKYVHKDVLKEILASPEGLHFEGERRDVTVLFSDLRGFTTFSELLSPEELTKMLNAYFSAMTKPILQERGTIDKFIGDAVMAFWNAPLYVTHHELHAVRAALLMQDALKEFNNLHHTTLAMGIGVHRGGVIVGNVGSHERVNYTILGDTVNLGSRVEGLTKKYGVEIIATEDVRITIDEKDILFRKLDLITVKGKTLPTVLYEVLHATEGKKATVKEYERGFALYQEKKFDEAVKVFVPLSEKGDAPSEKMLERIEKVRNDNTFDGIWRFDEK
jgi:adenylate cyclase